MRTLAVIGILAACASAPLPPATTTTRATVPVAAPLWSGIGWDHAEAVLFNQVPYGPGVETHNLRAWDPKHGMNPSIVERKPIATTLANRAIALVNATGGRVDSFGKLRVPAPCHRFLSRRAARPRASTCRFACGDILIAPDPRPSLRRPDERVRTRCRHESRRSSDGSLRSGVPEVAGAIPRRYRLLHRSAAESTPRVTGPARWPNETVDPGLLAGFGFDVQVHLEPSRRSRLAQRAGSHASAGSNAGTPRVAARPPVR